jgi:hypothetical protein
VDSKVAILVQDNVENDTITLVKHPASEPSDLARYIAKYPTLFVPEFLGTVDKQRNWGTTKNAEDDSAGTSIIGRMLNSDMVENKSVNESVEELHAINSTAKQLLGGGTSRSGAMSKSKKRTERDKKRGIPSIANVSSYLSH